MLRGFRSVNRFTAVVLVVVAAGLVLGAAGERGSAATSPARERREGREETESRGLSLNYRTPSVLPSEALAASPAERADEVFRALALRRAELKEAGLLVGGPTLTPSLVEVTLKPGQLHFEDKELEIPDLGDVPVDLVFVIDTTGSMGPAIAELKSQIEDVIANLDADYSDLELGLVAFKDHDGKFDSNPHCDYNEVYNQASGECRHETVGLTSNFSPGGPLVTRIKGLVANGGGDIPECHGAVLQWLIEDAGNPIGWRPGSRRLIVNLTDAPAHDCDFCDVRPGGCPSDPFSAVPGHYGVEPGFDKSITTNTYPNDVPIQSLVGRFKAAARHAPLKLVTIFVRTYDLFASPSVADELGTPLNSSAKPGVWRLLSQATDGEAVAVKSDGQPVGVDLAEFIGDVIGDVTEGCDEVTVDTSKASFRSWIRVNGLTVPRVIAADVVPPTTLNFTVRISPPAGTAPGTYTFNLETFCDGSLLGAQKIIVHVPNLEVFCPSDLSLECPGDVDPTTTGTPTVTASCPVTCTFTDKSTLSCGPTSDARAITRTWTCTGACGSASCPQAIDVIDSLDPTLVDVPPDATVQCDAVPSGPPPTASDSCDSAPAIASSDSKTTGVCPDAFTIARTWAAIDGCGNDHLKTQNLTVIDTGAPTLSATPANTSAACDAVPAAAIVTASDTCDPAVAAVPTETQIGGACPDTYTIERTWTATDRCGNATAHTQAVAVSDIDPPTFGPLPADTTVECDDVPAAATVTASDACDPGVSVTMVEDRVDGACDDTYTLLRTYTATDRCGNSVDHVQTIEVVDTTPPALSTIPVDATVGCDAIPAASLVTAIDACDPAVAVILVETVAPGTCADSYTLTRTWTAADRCGNAVTSSQTLTVIDPAAPVLSAAPTDASVECDAVPTSPTITAADTCDPDVAVVFTETQTNGSCTDNYTLTRIWSATDRCGNATVHTQLLTVGDSEPPTLSLLPADLTVECDAVPPADPVTATDSCDPDVAVVFTEVRANGACDDTYTLTRTWSATDRCGNAVSHTQVITVVDTVPPVLSGTPVDLTVECDAVPVAVVLTATDGCDPAVGVVYFEDRTDGTCADGYTLTRSWTATDRCGNKIEHVQTIQVSDTTPPLLSATPADLAVECDAVPTAVVLTATDNCDPGVTVTFTETRTDGACADSYLLTRIWTGTDRCGNAVSHTQVVTVGDTTKPVLSAAPPDTTAECDAVPPAAVLIATDNCDPAVTVTFTETRTDGACADSYLLTRVWTSTDRCGNVVNHTQVVTVVDTTKPVLSAAPVDSAVECDAVPPAAVLTATDNCDPAVTVTFTEARTDGACADSYLLTRIWTSTDRCGNVASHTQIVAVADTTPPVTTALLQPSEPLPPRSAASARSVCSPPSSRAFTVACDATDNCDPSPAIAARLLVTRHDVPVAGTCVEVVEEIPVACGEQVLLHLVAPPCPAKPPKSPAGSVSVNSAGIRVITGERIVLSVVATDRCGNRAEQTYDPTAEPSPLCDEVLADGTCCPPIAVPPDPKCKDPLCGRPPHSG